MKIITLIENTTYSSNLVAEHGLSIYIENNQKILFDTGQSNNFIKNANNLGINLEEIDTVIISHGHYDHAGGLSSFCEINKTAKIYVKENFFIPKFKEKQKFIGIENSFPDRIIYINNIIEISNNIFIVPEIKIINEWDTHFDGMYIKTNLGFEIDQFYDELFLVIKKDNMINILSGCSHRGFTNIINSALNYFNNPINLALGGFHTKDWNKTKMLKFILELEKYNISKIGCCHCTGIENYVLLKQNLNDKVFYNSTGNLIKI